MKVYIMKDETPIEEMVEEVEYSPKSIVSKMYDSHTKPGEHFSMDYASKVKEKYKLMNPIPEIYLAINALYHDYYDLFSRWFKLNLEDKIVESAVCFWFKDEDYSGNKVMEYFVK